MNTYERLIHDHLTKHGRVDLLRRGWPDFLVVDDVWNPSEGFGLEIKRGNDKVSWEQDQMHHALSKLGIRTVVTHGDEWIRLREELGSHLWLSDALDCYDKHPERPPCDHMTRHGTHPGCPTLRCPNSLTSVRLTCSL